VDADRLTFACATAPEERAARRAGYRTARVGVCVRRGVPAGELVSFGVAGGLNGIEVGAVLDATRADRRVELGASPRAGLMLLKAAKALAALDGRDHAIPDDVQALAPSVLPHRLLLAPDAAAISRVELVRETIQSVPAL